MEITSNAVQAVAANQNVLFTDSPIPSTNCCIVHREGSGLVLLKGFSKQHRARYRVTFGGNAAVPTGATVIPVSLAISIDGEPVSTTTMIVQPSTAGRYFNVFSSIFIDVPTGASYTISIKNTSTNTIDVQNANLIVERVA